LKLLFLTLPISEDASYTLEDDATRHGISKVATQPFNWKHFQNRPSLFPPFGGRMLQNIFDILLDIGGCPHRQPKDVGSTHVWSCFKHETHRERTSRNPFGSLVEPYVGQNPTFQAKLGYLPPSRRQDLAQETAH
jgi:hypothetical protein